MRITTLFAALALAFSPLVLAGQAGECGGTTQDANGKAVTCSCEQRPNCGEENDCRCTFDQYCKDTACKASSTLADALGSDSLPAFPPEPATSH